MHRINTRNRPLTLNEINLTAISEAIEYSLDFKKGINYCLRIGEQKRVYLKNWWALRDLFASARRFSVSQMYRQPDLAYVPRISGLNPNSVCLSESFRFLSEKKDKLEALSGSTTLIRSWDDSDIFPTCVLLHINTCHTYKWICRWAEVSVSLG